MIGSDKKSPNYLGKLDSMNGLASPLTRQLGER